MKWIALMAGGGLGAALRYALTLWVDQRVSSAFPWGTLSVNIMGCLLIGILATLADEREFLPDPTLRLFLITGLLGAFTTFSTVSLESLYLIETGRLAMALLNTVGSLAAGIVAVAAGVAMVRSLV